MKLFIVHANSSLTSFNTPLHEADGLLLQFSGWPGSQPALLKGWIARVEGLCGWYAFRQRLFWDRRALLSVTTDGTLRRLFERRDGLIEMVLWSIRNLVVGHLGYDLVPP